MAVDGVIVDIDGTLVLSNDAHARSWVESFASQGYEVSFDQVRSLMGIGGDQLIPKKAQLDPDRTVMLADTPYDIEAAGKIGVGVIAMRCGGFSDEALAGAIAIYDDPADLLRHYDRSPPGAAVARSTHLQGSEPHSLTHTA